MYLIQCIHKGSKKYIQSSQANAAPVLTSNIKEAAEWESMAGAKVVRDDVLDPRYHLSNVSLVRV